MAVMRLVGALVALGLVVSIVWAAFTGAIFEEGGAILALPWGVVTFIDLYAGFLFAAALILVAEPRPRLAIVLALSIFVLGNVVTLAWAVARAPLLLSRLRSAGAR